MAADDFAIVVGLTRYPMIHELRGAENDAKHFLDWLLDPAKGDAPDGHVFRVLTSTYADEENEPTMEQVEEEFEKLRNSVKAFTDENGRARRLYIFLAGHGLSWDVRSAALLTANANYEMRRSNHVAGRVFAEWFQNAGYFREIVLLMDCCRNEYPNTPPRHAWPDQFDAAKSDVSYFFGFATKGGFEAREMPIPSGGQEVRGLFTYTFLEGLDNAERDAQGCITGAALSKYIYNNMPQVPGLPKQEPYIEVVPEHAIIWTMKPQLVNNQVIIAIQPEQPADAQVVVETPELQPLGTFTAKEIRLNNLPIGIYNLRWLTGDQKVSFEVGGAEQPIVIIVNLEAAPEKRVTYVKF